MKKVSLLFLLVFYATRVCPQSGFSLEDYKQFINTHQNMTSGQLLQMHDAGLFNANLNINSDSIVYLDTICSKYNLTDYEKQLIKKNGFMASERLSFDSYGDAVRDIFFKDLPVFVSTDAILHSVHMSYDLILMQTEGEILIQKIKDILTTLHGKISSLDTEYGSDPKMTESLKDFDLYIGIARKLLGMNITMFYSSNTLRADTIMSMIDSLKMRQYSMFGEEPHYIDFSQFKPRGHYADQGNINTYPDLPKYFKAMIWLGRVEIYLLPPSYKVTSHDVSTMRTAVLSALVHKAAISSTAYNDIQEFDNIIKLFVGESDNVSLFNLNDLLQIAGITDPVQLTDTIKLKAFQDSLVTKPFAFQKINSQILMGSETDPDSIIPASAFMLLGQRFIIDSYITAQVVYDRIRYNNQYIRRMLPSTLDVLFGLGNDASGQLLKTELDNYHYSTNLATLRYLINGYDSTFWNSNLFNIWLNGIRQLNPPVQRNTLPPFMTTAAWWQEKMNTQLGSWSELRHDNVLYAKQSYTAVPICSFPHSYVEPFPEFYSTMKNFGIKLKGIIESLIFPNPNFKSAIIDYCNTLSGACDTLTVIAQKELDNVSISPSELLFLKGMLRYDGIAGYTGKELFNGWYYRMYYNPDEKFKKKDFIVVDIHTSAYDEVGGYVGWVKHVGTGKINLGVFVLKNPDNVSMAYVGPLYSYYDYTTTNLLRLTDAEWDSTYLALSLRPDWVNLYLANIQGLNRGTGGQLFTGVANENNSTKAPMDFVMLQNYPNPFNSTTLIKFSVPNNKSNNLVELTIYDIQGKVVKRLVNEKLQTGNYVTRWEGINDNNVKVTSGVYFCRGRIGDKMVTMKMLLLK
jgi:Protein of unknown function (DUF3160)/Secretion system C-terminal sorting domain